MRDFWWYSLDGGGGGFPLGITCKVLGEILTGLREEIPAEGSEGFDGS